MNATEIGLLTVVAVFAAGLFGLYGHQLLPATHRNQPTQDAIRLGIGMVSVLSSLVLGLLIASAKGSWDQTDRAVRAYAADLILLDETLRDFGDKAAEPRQMLRAYTARMVGDIWPVGGGRAPSLSDRAAGDLLERVRERIRALEPADKPAGWLQDQALLTHISLLRQRYQLIEQQGPAVRPIVLGILISWIMFIFASFGLNAPRNGTVIAAFFVCALAIGGSVFLILEMDSPFSGVLAISAEPMASALQHMQEPPR